MYTRNSPPLSSRSPRAGLTNRTSGSGLRTFCPKNSANFALMEWNHDSRPAQTCPFFSHPRDFFRSVGLLFCGRLSAFRHARLAPLLHGRGAPALLWIAVIDHDSLGHRRGILWAHGDRESSATSGQSPSHPACLPFDLRHGSFRALFLS